MNHVLLVGFMGSGKSSVGRTLADRLVRRFIDLDEEIERRAERDIPDIFCERGEAAFRADEREALLALAAEVPAVVACGGGIVSDERNRADLKRLGTVVWLRVSAERAFERAGSDSGRPLMDGRTFEEVSSLARSREPLYREVADIEISTDTLGVVGVTDAVLASLGERAYE